MQVHLPTFTRFPVYFWVIQLGLITALTNSPSIHGQVVLVEAEAFDSTGGWFVDQQFMDLMGSPFLLAHGMGRPVVDATTSVAFAVPGRYRVWARTRDWVAPWKAPGAPGRFRIIVDGTPLGTEFGHEGEEWHWQDGGIVTVADSAQLALHDLTGFEGRCDAILFSHDLRWQPPEERRELARFRHSVLGRSGEPVDAGSFDLVVVGGGVAGTCAAITAARMGLTVALIQDRPVLGGNSSSEVRVWPEGNVNQPPWPRIGDVVMELVPERKNDSKNAQSADVFDDQRKLQLVQSEPNISLFLEQRMNGANAWNGHIESIVCQHIRTADRVRIAGRWFLDSTGDGVLGYLAGADFEQTGTGHMGASNLWNIRCLCEDEDPLTTELQAACEAATFPRCPWAIDLSDKPFPGRDSGPLEAQPDPSGKPVSLGNWFWENGFDRDPIDDMERIRDQNFRAAYGAWDTIKNVEKRYPAHQLNWVAYIAGKRESRRLMGDIVLTAEDLRDDRPWTDGCFPCTWGIDTHFPDPKYAEGHAAGDEFIAGFTHGEGYTYSGPYWAPYRCLYSRNIDNLFMAGRDISVTHEALGAVRVMKTCGAMGEIVGLAASICKRNHCTPRDVYQRYTRELKALMVEGAGKIETHSPNDQGTIDLPARSARVRGGQIRYEAAIDSIGYWRKAGDTVEWKVQLRQPGRYRVLLQYACPPADAGGPFHLRVTASNSSTSGTVEATDTWSDFHWHESDPLDLPGGDSILEITSASDSGPLMKLRAVRLHPAQGNND
jgi:hypothetical protein